jgi:hypothetical protein
LRALASATRWMPVLNGASKTAASTSATLIRPEGKSWLYSRNSKIGVKNPLAARQHTGGEDPVTEGAARQRQHDKEADPRRSASDAVFGHHCTRFVR